MQSKAINFRTTLTIAAILLIGIAIFLNRTVANLGLPRFDLTEENIYTISEGAKNIVPITLVVGAMFGAIWLGRFLFGMDGAVAVGGLIFLAIMVSRIQYAKTNSYQDTHWPDSRGGDGG